MTEDGQAALPESSADTYTVAEAAVRAGVAPRTMRRWLPKQPLWAVKVEGIWRIRRAEFEAWLSGEPRSDTVVRAATSATVTAVRAEAEALRSEVDRLRTEADRDREEARQWREQAQAWQRQAEQLAEAITRLPLPAHEPEDAEGPTEDTAGQVAEVGERSWLARVWRWFPGR